MVGIGCCIPLAGSLAPSYHLNWLSLHETQHRERLRESVVLAHTDLCKQQGLNIELETFAKVVRCYQGNAFSNGLWPALARINHSWWPNAEVVWDRENRSHRVIIIREVKEGQEITHSYLHTLHSRHKRRQLLYKR